MDKKLTVQQFAHAVSVQCGVKFEIALEIVRCIFDSVSDRLADTGEAEVPSLGRFRVIRDGEIGIEFTPTKSLAEDINSPFQAFDALEVSEGFDNTVADVVQDGSAETQPLPAEEALDGKNENEADGAEATVENEISDAVEQSDTDDVFRPLVAMPSDEDNISEVLPAIPAIPTVNDSDDEVSSDVELQSTPPPFNPNKAYGIPAGGYSIAEDEEIFATCDGNNKRGRKFNFLYGIITGVVIAAALAALGFFVYEVLL